MASMPPNFLQKQKSVERPLTALAGLREYDRYIRPLHHGDNSNLQVVIRDYSLAAIELTKIDRKW